MDRKLIDAEAFLAAYPDCRGLRSKVESFPAAEPITSEWEVVDHTTNWRGTREPLYGCKRCGRMGGKFKTKFCPHCGAVMKGVIWDG